MQKIPPRYVPTLTQVVESKPASATQVIAPAAPPLVSPEFAQHKAEHFSRQLRQQLLVRTREYMDIELQRRIRETVSQLALEHAHKLFEEIQPQLEATITQVVDEAVKQAFNHASTPIA